MPEPRSVAYFGLRTNAYQLVAGAGVNAVRRRLKLAGLLHDEVVIEAGTLEVSAGQGQSSIMHLADGVEGVPQRWQSPRARRPTGEFWMTMRPGEAPTDAPATPMLRGLLELRWSATFMPFLSEPIAPATWLRPVLMQEGSEVRAISSAMAKQDRDDPALVRRWPDHGVREAIAKGAGVDFARTVTAEVPLVMHADPFHRAILDARVTRGEARPVLGSYALEVIDPRELTWEEITWLRGEAGWTDFRKVLADIEAEARADTGELGDLKVRIMRRYQTHLEQATARRASWRPRLATLAVGIMAGEAYGSMLAAAPGIGAAAGVAAAVAGELASSAAEHVGHARREPRWVAADRARRRVGGSRNR
jgi:hypothetical protein